MHGCGALRLEIGPEMLGKNGEETPGIVSSRTSERDIVINHIFHFPVAASFAFAYGAGGEQ